MRLVRFESATVNDLWQMDFKDHVATAAGRLHPLTVLDDCSRHALVLAACGEEHEETVRGRLTAAFRRYGLSWRMLANNGSPWGSTGGEPTRFAVWLMDLDVGGGMRPPPRRPRRRPPRSTPRGDPRRPYRHGDHPAARPHRGRRRQGRRRGGG